MVSIRSKVRLNYNEQKLFPFSNNRETLLEIEMWNLPLYYAIYHFLDRSALYYKISGNICCSGTTVEPGYNKQTAPYHYVG